VELMKQIVNNYIDQHQEIIFNNRTFIDILKQYVQQNYTVIFSQDILYQAINNYVTQNKTTVFNETLIKEIINNYVQNNYNTLISNETLNEIINNYVSINKTTVINETILYEVISNYFKTNYNLFIDETYIQQVINNYIIEHKTTLIDIDIVREVVNNYVKKNIDVIFDVDILNQVINNYFEENTTIINKYVSENTGIIKDVIVDGELCVVTLNNGRTVNLAVYDDFANIRDRVQSIVVVPNKNGLIYTQYGMASYIVTPASMATIIQDKVYKGEMTAELLVLDGNGNITTTNVYPSASTDGVLQVDFGSVNLGYYVALHIKDNTDGGTDYVTAFKLYSISISPQY
jgi:hypothetical protein